MGPRMEFHPTRDAGTLLEQQPAVVVIWVGVVCAVVVCVQAKEVPRLLGFGVCDKADPSSVGTRFEQGREVSDPCVAPGVAGGEGVGVEGDGEVPTEESVVHGSCHRELRDGGEADLPEHPNERQLPCLSAEEELAECETSKPFSI
jgi:hypothetical protein